MRGRVVADWSGGMVVAWMPALESMAGGEGAEPKVGGAFAGDAFEHA